MFEFALYNVMIYKKGKSTKESQGSVFIHTGAKKQD